ncbi:MAG: CapA family protein [Bacteroidota bacterium]
MFRFAIFFLFILVLANRSEDTFATVRDVETEHSDTITGSPGFNNIMLWNHHRPERDVYGRLDTAAFIKVIDYNIQLPLRQITIMAVGDIMPGTNFPSESYLPPSCENLFLPVKAILERADIATGNLEGVFSSNGGEAKNCNNPKTCYVFRIPDNYAACIRDAGFDILGVANNHVNDFGYTGRKNTAGILDEEGIPFAGFKDRPYVIVEKNGFRIGFCAFAPHTGTLDFKDYEAAAGIVARLKKKTDIVIVNFHAGAEGSKYQHITKTDEVFLGHNRGNPWYFAHKVIDAGADLVVGHGPHIVRAIEFYKGKLIAYSLGNFCTYARFNLSGPNAYAPVLEVRLNSEGEFVSGRIHSFLQLGEGGPIPDPDQKAMKRIRDLTKIDFPEENLFMDEHGNIIK